MSKVFLGGTCNNSTWRDKLIPFLEKQGIEYFNPVVNDWTPECQAEEERQKKICDVHLYLITPFISGYFSIAEAIQSSMDPTKRTIFTFIPEDGNPQQPAKFTQAQIKSLLAVGNLVTQNGGLFHMGWDNMETLAATIAAVSDVPQSSLTFGQAITLLKSGFALRREGWNGKGMFVVKQVPSHITSDIIPKMQSLPKVAKDILMARENPHIDYSNQMLIINPDGRADSWVPSVSDVFANDWEVVYD